MRPTQDDYDIIVSILSQEVGVEIDSTPFDPGKKGEAAPEKDWVPKHGPVQTKIFNDRSDVVGACGEKFTGKSIVFGDCIIAHCYEEHDALAVVIGNSHRALAEGFCHDLLTFNLPRWKDGNREPLFIEQGKELVENPKAGELMDSGIGLEYTGWKADPNNKDLYLKIRNRFGGWSRIRVLAIPNAVMVQSRVTNLNASLFYLEEATRTDGDDYYKWPSLQLYRRREIKGPQQFLFSCNPDDPKHWVHKWMYQDSKVSADEPGKVWPDDMHKPGIRRDPQVAFYYLRYKENMINVSAKNRETLKRTLRADPIMAARLMHSKWIAMPAGDSIFKTEFSEKRHVKGDLETKRGLQPVRGFPIAIGMDWGSRSVGIVFRQLIRTPEGTIGITFDSISYYQEMHKTRRLAVALLEKMRYWTEHLREEVQAEIDEPKESIFRNLDAQNAAWTWYFITGDDATTNFNPESGNIQARDLEDHMQEVLEDDPFRYRGIELPRIRGCPRPKGSKEKRVDIIAEALMEDRHFVSALCEDVVGMFLNLPQDKEKTTEPGGKNPWIHIHDANSYVEYYERFQLPDGFTNMNDGDAIGVSA